MHTTIRKYSEPVTRFNKQLHSLYLILVAGKGTSKTFEKMKTMPAKEMKALAEKPNELLQSWQPAQRRSIGSAKWIGKLILLSLVIVSASQQALAQTAEQIISSHITAIGGSEQLTQVQSAKLEGKAAVAGQEVIIRESVLNGKAYKNEIEFSKALVITEVYTNKGGWISNPLLGNAASKAMPDAQYKAGKDKRYFGSFPFLQYKGLGYKAELAGREKVGEVNALKIKVTDPQNTITYLYFDGNSHYLIKSVTETDNNGQKEEVTNLYSDYKLVKNIRIPYKVTTISNGGALTIANTVTNAEINSPLELSAFEKPTEAPAQKTATTTPFYKPVYPSSKPTCNCEALANLELPETKILSARVESSDSSCRVTAVVKHPPFDDKVTVFIALPIKNWNGRFLGNGGGGFVGGTQLSLSQPVAQGFAAGATDGGHADGRGTFAYDQQNDRYDWQSIRDFSHVAIHDMTVLGKTLADKFYSKPVKYAYFVGGSNGGRQAMEAVQRYPQDYNGVVALNPALYWNRFLFGFLWPAAVMNDANNYVSKQKLVAVTEAAIAACDPKDGLKDGVIEDPFSCSWDPREMVGQKVGDATFTESDADVVRQIWEGPKGHSSQFLWYGLTKGSDLTGYARTSGNPLAPEVEDLLGDWVKYFLLAKPDYNLKTITKREFEKLFIQSVDQYASLYQTSNANLSPFRDNGGKLVLALGLADNLIPPQGTIQYYNSLLDEMGGYNKTAKFARLFLYPGLDHGLLGSGPRTNPDDYLGAVIEWVEKGKAPNSFQAEARKNTFGDFIRKKNIYPYKGEITKPIHTVNY